MSGTRADKGQLDRFQEAARELDADQSDNALDRVMGKLDLKKKAEPQKEGKRDE